MERKSIDTIIDTLKSFVVFENQLIIISILTGLLICMPFLQEAIADLRDLFVFMLPDRINDIFIRFNTVYYSFVKVFLIILMFLWLPRYLLFLSLVFDLLASQYFNFNISFSSLHYFSRLLSKAAFVISNLLLIIMLLRTVIILNTAVDFIRDLNNPLFINLLFPLFIYIIGDKHQNQTGDGSASGKSFKDK